MANIIDDFFMQLEKEFIEQERKKEKEISDRKIVVDNVIKQLHRNIEPLVLMYLRELGKRFFPTRKMREGVNIEKNPETSTYVRATFYVYEPVKRKGIYHYDYSDEDRRIVWDKEGTFNYWYPYTIEWVRYKGFVKHCDRGINFTEQVLRNEVEELFKVGKPYKHWRIDKWNDYPYSHLHFSADKDNGLNNLIRWFL